MKKLKFLNVQRGAKERVKDLFILKEEIMLFKLGEAKLIKKFPKGIVEKIAKKQKIEKSNSGNLKEMLISFLYK